jgi:urease accessory protein
VRPAASDGACLMEEHDASAFTPPVGSRSRDVDAVLMVLGDGRFPVGGHAHSAGVESAVDDGRVYDVASLESFVVGRLHTTGLVDASLAAATLVHVGERAPDDDGRALLVALDREASVRITAPPLRAASRRLGRQLVRVAARCWPSSELAVLVDLFPGGAHQSVALGVVGLAAGLDAGAVARLSVHHTLTTPSQSAVRLLGLDPFEVAALTVRLIDESGPIVAHAVAAATGPLDRLPAGTGPLVEIAAIHHLELDPRLFAT